MQPHRAGAQAVPQECQGVCATASFTGATPQQPCRCALTVIPCRRATFSCWRAAGRRRRSRCRKARRPSACSTRTSCCKYLCRRYATAHSARSAPAPSPPHTARPPELTPSTAQPPPGQSLLDLAGGDRHLAHAAPPHALHLLQREHLQPATRADHALQPAARRVEQPLPGPARPGGRQLPGAGLPLLRGGGGVRRLPPAQG